MAGTYSQLHIQLILVVKRRQRLIKKEWKENLFRFMNTLIQCNNAKPIIINGVEDHVHLLIGIRPVVKISELARLIKTSSTNFINDIIKPEKKFTWQDGYAVFSYNKSDLPRLIRYIENQEEHHRKKDLKAEYKQLLIKHQVEFDPKYLIDE